MKVRSKERFTAEQWFSHEKPVKGVRRVDSAVWRNGCCPFCKGTQEVHGQVNTREGTDERIRLICSGEWVVTTVVTNAQAVYNPYRFHERFEVIDEPETTDQQRINSEHAEFVKEQAKRHEDFIQFCKDCSRIPK